METLLADLQAWYAAQCDEDWEHCYGIKISTLDNPGWSFKVELTDTLLEDKSFVPIETAETKDGWLNCRVKDKQFIGYSGPHQLEELITTFLDWAKSEPAWLAVRYETPTETKVRKDRELWAVLGDEVGPEPCRAPDCVHPHVQYSAFCRVHHFEMMRGYRYVTEG